jgi:hypothetical protein
MLYSRADGALAILQRVLSASVTVDKEVISSIGKGVLVFAAVAPGDTRKEVETMANKVLKMKLWDDEAGGRVRLPPDSRSPFFLYFFLLVLHGNEQLLM